jgi:hypothetical protein
MRVGVRVFGERERGEGESEKLIIKTEIGFRLRFK